MATSIKISQLPEKGANLEATDLLEVSEFNGTGYVSKSITGQEIIDASAGGGGVTDITVNAPLSTTGGTTPESSTSVSMATPSIQMFGQGNNLNSQGGTKSVNANQNMVVTAVVSESDITNTQTKLSKLQRNAEL